MSTALIPIIAHRIGNQDVQSVDGRILHAQLGLSRQYANWMRGWIKRANLLEHRDFEVFNTDVKNPSGGRPTGEYALTLDAAKCIAMMSGGEKGDTVREYFLDCERQAQAVTLPVMHDPALQAIMHLVTDLDATKHQLALVGSHVVRAEVKADMALDEARCMTLEEFVVKNGLLRQFPESQWPAMAKWLGHFCQQYGLATPKVSVPGKSWDEEKAYPLQALAALQRHELKKPRQVALVMGPNGITECAHGHEH